MAQDSIPFEGTIQETMLGPLWARAKYNQLYPELLDDQKSYLSLLFFACSLIFISKTSMFES